MSVNPATARKTSVLFMFAAAAWLMSSPAPAAAPQLPAPAPLKIPALSEIMVQPAPPRARPRFDPTVYSRLTLAPNISLVPDETLVTVRVFNEWDAYRNGVGFDFDVPNLGIFFLNLYAKKKSFSRGKRWLVAGDTGAGHSVWSAGATADLIRTEEGGRKLVLIPQFTVDLGRAINAPGQMQACIQRAYWNSLDPLARGGSQMVQLSLKWRF